MVTEVACVSIVRDHSNDTSSDEGLGGFLAIFYSYNIVFWLHSHGAKVNASAEPGCHNQSGRNYVGHI